MAYTTLAKVQSELKGTEAARVAGTDQQIMQYIRTVTDRIKGFGYQFEPLYVTKKITPTGMNTNAAYGLLSLNDFLLEVKSITVGGRAVTYGTDIVSEPDDGQTPIQVLRIADLQGGPIRSWYPCCASSFFNSIVIAGYWGMRTGYSTAGFFDSGVDTPVMTATQPTIVVSDVTGPDIYDRTPLFSPGNLLRFDDELAEVTRVNMGTRTLALLRGARGTTAATHTAGTAIRIFEVEDDVANCATRQACLLYARRGAYQQVTSYPDGINVTYPSDLLAEVRATIQRFNFV